MEGGCRPIVTIPRDLSFYGSSRKVGDDDDRDGGSKASSSGYPIYLTEDWDSGIGGGLWTTGLALGRYFATSPHFLEEFRSLQASKRRQTNDQTTEAEAEATTHRQEPIRVLELGSGNGFLGVCLVTAVAVAEANDLDGTDHAPDSASRSVSVSAGLAWPGIELIVTDTAEHLSLMRTTIESNLSRILPQIRNHHTGIGSTLRQTEGSGAPKPPEIAIETIARVAEYLWGEDYDFGGGIGNREPNSENERNSETTSRTRPRPRTQTFDLIIGSDVAYRDHLHDPLIAALEEFCVPRHTVALIGVTMNDTKPIFFQKLSQRGFRYEKLADHLLGEEFSTSSRQFGIFCISKG